MQTYSLIANGKLVAVFPEEHEALRAAAMALDEVVGGFWEAEVVPGELIANHSSAEEWFFGS